MNTKDMVKFLIPLAAVVVIFESVVLIGNLTSNNETKVDPVIIMPNVSPVVTVKKESAVVDLVFEVASRTMEQGKSYPVSLNMLAKKDLQIDTFDLYVKYDPTALEISNLTFDKKLGKPTFAKVSKDKGLVVANVYLTEATGLKVTMAEVMKLMSFSVVPKKAGMTSLEMNTGNVNSESATMLVENGTAKVIPFSSNVLEVSISQ